MITIGMRNPGRLPGQSIISVVHSANSTGHVDKAEGGAGLVGPDGDDVSDVTVNVAAVEPVAERHGRHTPELHAGRKDGRNSNGCVHWFLPWLRPGAGTWPPGSRRGQGRPATGTLSDV